MSQEKQFCRNCGKRDLAFSQEGTVRFWEPGLCSECHHLPIIGTRYDAFTGERVHSEASMSKETYKVISEHTHECGQVISTVMCSLTDVYFAVKPDPPFDLQPPPYVIAGPYIPPPQYKTRLELSGYCESLTVTNTGDICPKCGNEVLLSGEREPTPRHVGKLPGGDTYEVYYDGEGKDTLICVQGTHNLSNYEVILEPKQALSLLAWLQQEREKLEALAKEQAE